MELIKNNFCLIPPSVWKHPDLNLTEKCLLGRIHALSSEKGYCHAGNSYLAEELGYKTSKSLSNAISRLVAKGFLIREVSRTNGKEVEERRLKINWIGIELIYQGKVESVEDTPLHQIMDTSPSNNGYPLHLKVEERVDTRIENRIDIFSENKKQKKTSNLEQQLTDFIEHFNIVYEKNYRVPSGEKGWVKNYKKWSADYSLEQMKEAVTKSKLDNFYCDKLTPDMFFRTNEDRIDRFLQLQVKPKKSYLDTIREEYPDVIIAQ